MSASEMEPPERVYLPLPGLEVVVLPSPNMMSKSDCFDAVNTDTS